MRKEILQLKKIAENKTILICEDDIAVLEELKSILSMFFDRVLVAKDGQEGLNIYNDNSMDISLIVTDINMPYLNGLDMLEKIKNINNDQKCLVLSAHDDLKYVLQIIELGVNQFMPKPYDVDDMLIKIFKILENLAFEDTIRNKHESMVSLVKTLEIFLLDENFDREGFKEVIEKNKNDLGITDRESDFTIDMW